MRGTRLAVICLAAWVSAACASEGWRGATGHADPEGEWQSEAGGYDLNTNSYASDTSNRSGYGAWLHLTYDTPVHTDRLRIMADFGYGIVDKIDVDVRYDGDTAFTDVHEGAVPDVTYSTHMFAEGDVAEVRYRFHYT